MKTKFIPDRIMIAALYIIPLTGLSIDIYVPSHPAVSSFFNTSHVLAQNTISIYILGLGISQMICGSIIDRFGRRLPLLISLCIYFILSLLIIRSNSIDAVTYLRLLQGISMGFSAVSARSVFLDLYSGSEYYKKASYMTIAYAIGPIIAPAIGGYLQHLIGWEACFYFLSIYSFLAILIVFKFMPETLKSPSAFNLRIIFIRYVRMSTNRLFLLGVISLTMLNTTLMLFNLIGPFLIQDKMGYTPVVFGQMALLCGVCWFSGNLINRLLINLSRERKITIALTISIADLLLMLLLAKIWFNLAVIIIPICILLIAASVIFSNYFVHTPTLFPEYSATASAFMAGSFGLLSSGVCAFYTKILSVNDQVPLIYGYLCLIFVCVASRYLLGRSEKINN